MNSTQSPSRLRLITLLIPPSNDPLLTPYKKQINPKIMPLKRNYSILSNIRESPKVKQQKLQLSKNDFEKINRSYQSLKRFKKTYSKQSENEEDIQSDPQYLNLIQMRKSILIKKNAAEKSKLFHLKTTFQMEEKQSSFLRLTQPIDRLKLNPSSKNKSPLNKQKLTYLVKQKSTQISTTLSNAFLGQKQSPKSSRYFHRR